MYVLHPDVSHREHGFEKDHCAGLSSGLHENGKTVVVHTVCCVWCLHHDYIIKCFHLVLSSFSYFHNKVLEIRYKDLLFLHIKMDGRDLISMVQQQMLNHRPLESPFSLLCGTKWCSDLPGAHVLQGATTFPTVSADLNSVALINKSDKCDLVERAFVVLWQLLIYVPAVTDSILIFMASNRLLPWWLHHWATFP